TGDANLNGAGNDLANTLTGNSGNNSLDGGAGADSLDGGAGVDTLAGGLGDDTFVADGADLVVEVEDGGTDIVLASADHSLAANVEHLTLTGSGHIGGTGNALANAITGNIGNNALDGGAGADTLAGGLGDDTYTVDDAGDLVVELGGSGIDTVIASVSYSLFARYAENLTLTGTDNLNAIGNSLRNVMTGNAGNNAIDAAAGNDLIDGGAGNDTLTGGLGDDTFVVDADDAVVEAEGGGNDIVRASVSHVLAAHVETLVLTGTGDLNGTGNASANTITGTAGNNALDGGAGADTVTGGLGNDTYTVDHAGDAVVEAGGEGTDAIIASVSYSLVGRAVENLTLTGAANLTATGNSLGNGLTGNAGSNLLTGAAGDDVLDGGAGADSLTGGVGDDTYYVDNAGDKVNENHLEGTDTIISSVSYSLFGRAVEALTLTGAGHLTATGNSLANSLTGNAGNNWLDGGTGADSLAGGAGDDTYSVDNAGDVVTEATGEGADAIFASVTYSLVGRAVENLTLTGSANLGGTGNSLRNNLTGNTGNNLLTGAAGDDLLNGSAGADSLYGGLGDDTFYVDNAGDKVYENHLEGTDTILSSVSYSLFGRAVEVLTLTGAEHLTATGNGLANSLTGNSGNNVLEGGAGADTLAGAAGDDTYYVDDIGDKVVELTSEGTDLVLASVSYSLAGRVVENLTLTGTGNINATGNSLGNSLTGNSGVNKLDGGAGHDRLDGGVGADSLYGGLGDDTFYVDNAGDKVYESHFEGHDLIIASVSYTLFGRAVDDLVLSGTDNLSVTGNSLNNSLTGNIGNNVLDGGVGADTLAGGLGDDTYYVDYSGDVVNETGASGTDTIFASVSYSLAGRTVESLILTGTANLNATGNASANSLTGNDGKNRLDGGAGNDNLTGGLGADVFVFFSGKDTVTDFTASQNDSIDVHAYTAGVAHAGLVAQVGADVVITLGAGSVTVLNATQADVLSHIVW
ncbi:hypothetical protein ABAC460_00645, partial [Asticcacaulis sp. AC460]|uniref:beta strand repeat-containing protein n=1 Tax=Asticcacaulis sp. AC460 TaxID=1282360 RepID=UPI0003C3F723